MAKTTLSATLGDFVYDLSFEDLPATVVERAKISIADGIACAFDGRHMPSSEIALNTWKEMKRAGNVTLWVNGEKADLESTAWANCLLMHSILHDDTQDATVGHMGSLIIPAALGTGEREGKSGAEVIAAVVAAYEVACRIGTKSGLAIVRRGFRGSPVFGTFAAAVAGGKLMGLTREQTRNSIALAANFSCGLLEASNAGSMEWRFQNGTALRNGLLAAQLSRNGLPAATTTLEGERGFFASFGGPELRAQILKETDKITETLGQDFEILNSVFKPHATCFYNQLGVDVTRGILTQHSIRLEDIERVTVFVEPPNKAYPGGDFSGPFSTIDQALLSKPFSIAAAIKYEELTSGTYLSDLNEAGLGDLAGKVVTEGVEGMGFLDTKVEFRLKNGQTITGDQSMVDMGEYTLDRKRTVDKFCRLTAGSLEKKAAENIVGLVFDMPTLSTLAEFFEAFGTALHTR